MVALQPDIITLSVKSFGCFFFYLMAYANEISRFFYTSHYAVIPIQLLLTQPSIKDCPHEDFFIKHVCERGSTNIVYLKFAMIL